MERILSTVFPCCFPRRHNRNQATEGEQTPLLRDRHGSSSSSSSAGGKLTSALTAAAAADGTKAKYVSILPAPRYNAATLRTIVDDLNSKVISLDTAADEARLPQPVLEHTTSASASASSAMPVAAVHSLKLNIPPTLPSSFSPISATATASKPKLVDIWSAPSASTSGSTTPSQPVLSYSAAAKKATSKKKGKKMQSPHAKGSAPSLSVSSLSAEQTTFESLSEVALTRPLVHAWEIEDEHH